MKAIQKKKDSCSGVWLKIDVAIAFNLSTQQQKFSDTTFFPSVFNTVKDLLQRKKIVDRIITKLVVDENSLVELETEPVEGEEKGPKILVINPNCVLDGDIQSKNFAKIKLLSFCVQ